MNEELTVLAGAGAAAVVAAMATDLWQGTRDAVLGLFRRSGRGGEAAAGAEIRLDRDAALVREAESPDAVRQRLLAFWAAELTTLLRQDPSCRVPLARLAGDIGVALRDGAGASGPGQTNSARGSGTVYAVQHGDLHAYRPGPAGTPHTSNRPPSSAG